MVQRPRMTARWPGDGGSLNVGMTVKERRGEQVGRLRLQKHAPHSASRFASSLCPAENNRKSDWLTYLSPDRIKLTTVHTRV